MNCPKCGATVQEDHKFCYNCGAPIAAAPRTCPSCGYTAQPGASFCPNCGYDLKGAPKRPVEQPPKQQVSVPESREISTGETVIKDTGTFPISYIKSAFFSTNGKLYLTNQRLLFKAGALQGVGGVSVGGIFLPNPKDAEKSKERISIPLSAITNVEHGWANVTVHVGDTKYKFGGYAGDEQVGRSD